MDNIIALHNDLGSFTYTHGGYKKFYIFDPKPRTIHKASVRDRLLHHAIYRILYPFFDRTFASDSFSCRNDMGTHRAMNRLREFAYKVSRNHTRTCWILKCDIRKFFDNIHHDILLGILRLHIPDARIMWLLERIIGSFSSTATGVGLPLGNLTSQLFVNIYMNMFDQFAKHRLEAKYYIRYADDFLMLSDERAPLRELIPQIAAFLRERLRLELHPRKLSIETLASGVDFLGWVHFTDHRVPRATTTRRMFQRISEHATPETLASYRGLLGHGNTAKMSVRVESVFMRAAGHSA